MNFLSKFFKTFLVAGFSLFVLGVLTVFGAYLYVAPNLPDADSLKDIQFTVPMRVLSADGLLIAEFGERRRIPLAFDQIPETLRQAVLAAEDDRFYEHPGVDYQGILRAAWELATTGHKGSGGSTITMQVARNFFLGREKTYIRKLNEVFLALKIERHMTKDEILALYLNKIFLGNRAYGVGSAAQVYYGLPIDQLSLPQYAMIAGLPKAPSQSNPIANPKRAVQRRNYVLGRMHTLGFIDDQTYATALQAPVTASYHGQTVELEAPYVAEMARAWMLERFGEQAYVDGYRVETMVDSRLQTAATSALREALLEYDRRHGYRGAMARVSLPGETDSEVKPEAVWAELLADYTTVGGLPPALVVEVAAKSAKAFVMGQGVVEVPWKGLSWAKPYISNKRVGNAPKAAADVVQPGDIVRIKAMADGTWWLAEVPAVSGALVSVSPKTGAIVALVGGFDFNLSKFNRVVQAERQPGSNFKPFLYSAALEHGFTAATLINDAPVVFDDVSLETTWRPENYSGKFFGPTRLREALYKSRNLVSIRILDAVGIEYVRDYATRFGFRKDQLPGNLSLALGSLVATPLQMVRGFSVFANGGYRVDPYVIARVLDGKGEVIYQARPPVATKECAGSQLRLEEDTQEQQDGDGPHCAPRVITPQNDYIITSILRDVIKRGTGRKALVLKRKDLAGKTGTTNDQNDAWFSGFNGDLVTTAWVGFDQLQPLGNSETGGRAALPMWIKYMKVALDGLPETRLRQPPGLVTVRIDPETGMLAGVRDKGAIFETFRKEYVPKRKATRIRVPVASGTGSDAGAESVVVEHPEELF